MPIPTSVNLGFALVAKGEFSIILAGVAAKVARAEIHFEALTAFMVLLMSVIGPRLMKESYTIIDFGSRLGQRIRTRYASNNIDQFR